MNELKTKEARSNELLSFLEEEHSKVKNFKDSVFIKNATPISWLQDHDARLVAKVVEIVKKDIVELYEKNKLVETDSNNEEIVKQTVDMILQVVIQLVDRDITH